MEHINDAATDVDVNYIYFVVEITRDNNSEKWIQCIRCFLGCYKDNKIII